MNNTKLLFKADRPLYSDTVRLFIGEVNLLSGQRYHGFEVTFTPIEDDGEHRRPTIELTEADAQALMDALYAAGIHPTQAMGSQGQLQATREHLEDMRRLVFPPERVNQAKITINPGKEF